MGTKSFFEGSVSADRTEITVLLRAWGDGDGSALDRLAPMVYNELRSIAHCHMLREKQGQTLQTTALVNEAYLRLVDVKNISWQDRAHFYAVSAQMMRRILVDGARTRLREKRGGGLQRLSFDEVLDEQRPRDRELVAIDDALAELARMDERKSRVIELRFFGGLSVEETAAVLKISPQSVMRDWKLAKAWMALQLNG
jgi:RNA polymerase sigma factor (TIGR02999 family)